MKNMKIKKESKSYKKALSIFKLQYGDVIVIKKIFLNKDNKVYAGEWIDSKGVIHFNSGYLLDLEKTITVV